MIVRSAKLVGSCKVLPFFSDNSSSMFVTADSTLFLRCLALPSSSEMSLIISPSSSSAEDFILISVLAASSSSSWDNLDLLVGVLLPEDTAETQRHGNMREKSIIMIMIMIMIIIIIIIVLY